MTRESLKFAYIINDRMQIFHKYMFLQNKFRFNIIFISLKIRKK